MSANLTLNFKMRELLAAIATADEMETEQIRSFNTHSHHGNQNSALRTLVRRGYLEQPALKLFRATQAGRDYLNGLIKKTPVQRPVEEVICYPAEPRRINVMSTHLDISQLGQAPYRPGSMDAYGLPSRIGPKQVFRKTT